MSEDRFNYSLAAKCLDEYFVARQNSNESMKKIQESAIQASPQISEYYMRDFNIIKNILPEAGDKIDAVAGEYKKHMLTFTYTFSTLFGHQKQLICATICDHCKKLSADINEDKICRFSEVQGEQICGDILDTYRKKTTSNRSK